MTIRTTYRYHPKYFYFLSTCKVQEQDGEVALPSHCTLKPPPSCEAKKAAFFDEKVKEWTIRQDLPIRTRRFQYELLLYGYTKPTRFLIAPYIGELSDPNFEKLSDFFSQLSPMDNYVNPLAFTMSFKHRVNHLNNRIQEFFTQYNKILTKLQSNHSITMDESTACRVEKEEIIHEIKRLFDLIAITIGIGHSSITYYNAKHRVELQGIGQLLHPKCTVKKEIKDAILFKSYSPLLKLINDLHNGLKHDVLAEEIDNSQFQKRPRIHVAKIANPRGDLTTINIYKLDFELLIYACNGFLCDIFDRKKDDEVSTCIYIHRTEQPKL